MFAMLVITTILRAFFIIVEVVAVLLVVLIALDFLHYTYKEHRADKKRDQGRHHKSEMENFIAEVKYMVFEMRLIEIKEAVKAETRRAKEETATGGFFEESYVNGFDTTGALIYRGEHRYPTPETAELVKAMDDRAADEIFNNTEEL